MKAPSILQGSLAVSDRVFKDAGIVETYESRLSQNLEWAMSEGSRFFENRGAVQDALRNITSRLQELGIDYAVVGGMALFSHGFRRFTEDVDLLVTRVGLRQIHRQLPGLGYLPPFAGSKNLRDTQNGVKIEFLVAGDYPGDGKPKPVSFPDPSTVSIEKNGVRYIDLPALIELKLASGISNPDRMKDISDVLELIKLLNLPMELSNRLNPFVQVKYKEIWDAAHPTMKRFIKLLNRKQQEIDVNSGEYMNAVHPSESDILKSMLADGVTIDSKSTGSQRYVRLLTTDPILARKYDMHEESEIWDEGEDAGKASR